MRAGGSRGLRFRSSAKWTESLGLCSAPFWPIPLVAADDARELGQPRVAPERPEFVGRLPSSGLVERAWVDVDLIWPRIVGVDLRPASRAGISPAMLGARKVEDVSLYRHGLAWEDGIEAERRPVQFPACQAMADAD